MSVTHWVIFLLRESRIHGLLSDGKSGTYPPTLHHLYFNQNL